MERDLVILGGTFDPVHNGHLIISRSIAQQCGFERITLMPAAVPPHKGGPRANVEQRLEMLRLATEGDATFEVCDLELRREGRSYTYDTLQELGRIHGPKTRLNWIIGGDMLADLPNWHRAKELLDFVRFRIAVRQPWQERLEDIWAELEAVFRPDQVAQLKESLVETPVVDISSTEIRRKVAAGEAIGNLVPAAVEKYILENNLYHKIG